MIVLWDAGQQRTAREGRERLTELYVGVRDGYVAGNVSVGRAKWKGGGQIPAYAKTNPETPRAQSSVADRDAALARLGALFDTGRA